MLVPHWFKTFYQFDHGLNMYIDQTELLFHTPDLIKNIDEKIKDKNLEELFITDIKKVFNPHRDQTALPIWDIWFEGHGNTDLAICGLYIKTFQKVLNIFAKQLFMGTLYVESCFVGGNNTFTLMDEFTQKPLPYHIILGTIGETKSYTESPNRQKSIFKQTNKIISTFFHNAAQIEELDVLQSQKTQEKYLTKIKKIKGKKEISPTLLLKQRQYELKYIGNLAFYNVLQSLTKRIITNVGSLHGSEYLPQFKIKESKQFKTLEEEPGFFILKQNDSQNLDIPSSINTLIIYENNIKNLNVHLFGLTPSLERVHPQIKNVIKDSKYVYPTFIIMQKIENESKDKSFLNSWLSSKKVLKQETASLSIDSLTLHNDKDKTSGIMTFFESAFLTTLIQGGYLIKINRLSGLDDLSQRFFSTSLTSAIKKQKTEATFKKNQRLTLTDVKIITPHIINQTETFIISFLIENQPFSLTYELNEDTMIWELVIDDLKNPEVIIQNIFGKYPLQTIIINPSYKMDEKQEYINAFLIRGIDCNAPNEDKITPLFQATIQHFTEKSNYYLIIESLLKAGADIYYKPKNSRIPSPLEYVISKKNAKIIALFKKYEETESTSDKENEPKVKLNINEKINTFDFYL